MPTGRTSCSEFYPRVTSEHQVLAIEYQASFVVGSGRALLRSLLLRREGPRCDRRPLDATGDPRASAAGRLPLHRPADGAARRLNQPARRPFTAARGERAGATGSSTATGGRNSVPPD